MQRIPLPVWIAIGIIGGMILLAIITYSVGWWEPSADVA